MCKMTDKIIYFTIAGKNEQAEFSAEDSTEDVREIFRSAAEAGPYDVLKLYNTNGSIVNISNSLHPNDVTTRYKLEVVVTHCAGESIAAQLGFDIGAVEMRLERLERKVFVENGVPSSIVSEMRRKVDAFKEKLEVVDHLSWLGLHKNMEDQPNSSSESHLWTKQMQAEKQAEKEKQVHETFTRLSNIQVVDDVRMSLRQTSFDTWQWDEGEMLILLRQMFIDLGLTNKFNIELPLLNRFLYEIYKHYNPVPFHNFKHCFTVTQMMYGLIWMCDLTSTLDDVDILILLTSAICHDVEHPGYNNAYQVNARTTLALRYNDISPLENHHCAIAFELLQAPGCEIFRNLSSDTYKKIREGIIRCILATDMAKHSEILAAFKNIVNDFDFANKEHKATLMMILIKVADISNEVRPMKVSEPWLECLLQEFFNQSDVEKLEGLPVAPFMDREKVTKPSAQIGFIKFVLLPLFQVLSSLFPVVEKNIVCPVKSTLDYYTEMQDNNSKQGSDTERRKSVTSLTDKT